MKLKIAQLLRRWAEKLDPRPPSLKAKAASGSTRSGGVVVENENPNLWHPDQHGNVIEVEPEMIRKARRDGTLSDM